MIARTVHLPTRPQIGAGEAYEALGIGRNSAAHHRRRNGFPVSTKGKIETSALAAWLVARGIGIKFV